MPTFPTASRPARILGLLLRAIGYAGLAAGALVCVALLVLRFYVFPRIDDFRPRIESLLTGAVGRDVAITGVSPAWDGWNPRLVFAGVRMRDAGGRTQLELPAVDVVVSWRWMLVGQLRMKVLSIDEPSFTVRRDEQGRVHVVGVAFDQGAETDATGFGEWVLKQRSVVIRNATVTWIDERSGGIPLTLERVEFRLENTLGRHRFGLTGAPPPALASPLDVRGDFRGDTVQQWRQFSGRLYVRVDFAEVAAWRRWVPVPEQLVGGVGGARMWLQFAGGEINEVIGDLDLAEVRLRTAGDRTPLALARLSGRVAMRARSGQREVKLDSLSMVTASGAAVGPADGAVVLAPGEAMRIASGEFRLPSADLAISAGLLGAFALPRAWDEALATHAPRGSAEAIALRWQAADAKTAGGFAIKARLRDVSLSGQGVVPTLTGGAGSLEATEKGGSLQLAAREARLDLPEVFFEPLQFDTVSTRAGWQLRDGIITLRIDELAFANPHAAGVLSGRYRRGRSGPGWADLSGSLARADPRQVHRYLPRVAGDATRLWLRDSLQGGSTADTRFRLVGELAEFPFATGKGEFQVTTRVVDAELRHTAGWPPISGIRADVVFEGPAMRISATEGRILGARLGRVRASIPNLEADDPLLRIDGEASGPTSEFLRYIAVSPVAQMIDRFSDGIEAGGEGSLALKLEIPLGDEVRTRVAGAYSMRANRVRISDSLPVLDKVNGTLAFSDRDVRAENLSAELLGGPVQLSVTSAAGKVNVAAAGNVDLAQAMRAFDLPGGDAVRGRTDWRIAIDSATGSPAAWDLSMPMQGVAVDLPPPLGKTAEVRMPVRVERRPAPRGRDSLALTVGDAPQRVAQLKILGRPVTAGPKPESMLLLVGRATGEAGPAGITIKADLPEIDVDRWLARWDRLRNPQRDATLAPAPLLRRDSQPAAAARATAEKDRDPLAGLDLVGVELRAGVLHAMQRRWHDVALKATSGPVWRADIDARELAGQVDWQTQGPGVPAGGRLAGRLQRVDLGGDDGPAPRSTAAERAGQRDAYDPRRWPSVDLIAESLRSRGRELGRLEIAGLPQGADWRVERLQLVSPDGEITADGWWRGGVAQRTEVSVHLAVRDASAFLRRWGYPDAVRGAATTLKGQVRWPGGPRAFDYADLAGDISIEAQAGQFTKMDPGLAKLLGVLNLQALPRRITLDFRDVFSEGFAFDSLSGHVHIEDGVMKTRDLKFAGPGARVEIAGEANLVEETQNLNVRVYPSLSASVAVGAAIGLANPLAGAAVLLGQKLLQDPVEKMFASDYRITGPWTDPKVTRASRLGGPTRGTEEVRQ